MTAGVVGWEALHDAVTCQHAAIHGKVAAHHEGSHGSILLSECVRGVRQVRLVLASVNQDQACEPGRVSVALVGRIGPTTPAAEA
jgi:hypothetical protein